MLFNSYEFCLLFLPVTFALFWGWHSLRWRLGLLTFASFAFYSFSQFTKKDAPEFDFQAFLRSLRITSLADVRHTLWAWRFSIILVASSSVDYFAAKAIVTSPAEARGRRKLLLAVSLVANLGLLAFFKYAGFFSQIAADLSRAIGAGRVPILELVLPVGISFYTFESMSYVIDIYRGVARPAKSYLDYACFISFFPHLVAGPIIRYSDILHQFRDVNWTRRGPDWDQVCIGVVLFTMGLVKKLVIADHLAAQINPLWDMLGRGGGLGATNAWGAVLGYTFQLYFDFSGYSDMATGLGHMFGVRLPQNFDSPYKATDPVDFWKRWHITLGAWLRDYLYIPLGGDGRKRPAKEKPPGRTIGDASDPAPGAPLILSYASKLPDSSVGSGQGTPAPPAKRSGYLQYRNLFITMLLGGLWHGAAWLFIVWGAWHGLLLVGTHYLKRRFGARGVPPGQARGHVGRDAQETRASRGTKWAAGALGACVFLLGVWWISRKQLNLPLGVAFALAAATVVAGVALLKRLLPGGDALWSPAILGGLLGFFLLFVLAKPMIRPYFPPIRHVPEWMGVVFLIPMLSARRHLTFLLVVIGWVLFRSADARGGAGLAAVRPALTMFRELLGLIDARQIVATGRRGAEVAVELNPGALWGLIGFGWLWCNFVPNSFQVAYQLRYRWWHAMAAATGFGVCVLHFGMKMDFLYFRF